LPEAILNFIALFGWHPEGDREIISLEEMIKEFKLEKINKSPAVFNISKLNYFNRYYLRIKPVEEILQVLDFKNYQKDLYPQEKLLKIIELGKERALTLNDILPSVEFFFKDFDYPAELLIWKNISKERIKNNLELIKKEFVKIKEEDFTAQKIKEVLDGLSGQDKGPFFWPLRVALSGKESSPPPFDLAEIFGKEKTLVLIDKAIKKL
jgi:nondiscriminating glutamyl-tRNA synthetase